jgi:hypothetical protein
MEQTVAQDLVESHAEPTRVGLSRVGGLAGRAIFYLIGFRRRFIVMAEWAWLYLRNERGARLIIGDVRKLREQGRRTPLPARAIEPQKEATTEIVL